MFKKFFGEGAAAIYAKEFAERVMKFNRNVSPAQIQGYFMFHKNSDCKEVVNDVKKIWDVV